MSQTTTPSGALVCPLSVMDEETGLMQRRAFSRDELERHCDARTAVAAMIARNAELEAAKERLIADIRKRDTAIHAWANQARNAETKAGALAAENKALREAVIGLEFDVYELTPQMRKEFGGGKVISVVNMDSLEPLHRAMARTPAKGNDA